MDTPEVKKLLKEELRPLKESAEIITQKVKSIDARVNLMWHQLSHLEDQLSIINEKMDESGDQAGLKHEDM